VDWIEANRIARRFQCADCGGLLTIFPDPVDRYKLACAANPSGHHGYIRRPSLTQLWRQGAALPLEIANRLEKKFGGEQMATTELMKLDKAEVERRMKVAMKHFGFVVDQYGASRAPNVEEMVLLVDYCLTYGFDPILHEVCLYQGRPYPMIDGLRRKAHETGQYRGLRLEPILDKEFKVALGFGPNDIVFKATARKAEGDSLGLLDGTVGEYERYDGVTEAEITEMVTKTKDGKPYETARNPVIAKRTANMAQVRAERDALRAAFSFQFPTTGHVIEAEYSEVKEEPAVGIAAAVGGLAAMARKPKHEVKGEIPKPKLRDPATVKSVQDYLDACKEDFGLDEQAALAEANATTRMGIINPMESYRQVAAVRE